MEQQARQKGGPSTRAVEIAVAILTLALGVLVVHTSYQLGSRWGADGPGAGYFPFYIGLLICICSLANLVSAVAARQLSRRVFVEWEALRRVLAVVIPAAFYIAGIYLVGLYVSSLIYIAAFMMWIGGYLWLRSLLVALGVSVSLFLMFEVWFKVPLPKGAYNMLGFLGY